jgi:hypothetical protein
MRMEPSALSEKKKLRKDRGVKAGGGEAYDL